MYVTEKCNAEIWTELESTAETSTGQIYNNWCILSQKLVKNITKDRIAIIA